MATVIFIKESKQTPSAMRGCIHYCVQEKKTVDENGRQYVGGVNCLGQHAYEEFMATKNLYGKACGTYFYQYVQSFQPGEIQSYEEAHRIGLEFAGKSFPGYEVLVATHLDAQDDRGVQRVHNHFIVNSVSFEDGRKIHFTPNTLQELRKISDDICRDHGLSVLPPSERRNGQGIGTREYRATMRGEGWKFGLINDIDTAMAQAGDRREFCDILASVGYSVTWTNERKYITFTCPNGRKVRDNKLHDNKYTKENLEYEFRIRKQITEHADSQPDGQAESGIQNSGQDNRGNAVSADCLCDSEGGLERLSGMDKTGSDLSAHAVSADSGADDQGRNASVHGRDMERNPELGGGCDRKRAENGGEHCAESADAVESEQGAARTGWEDARAVYLRSRLEGNQSHQRIQGSAYGYEAVDHHGDCIDYRRFGDFKHGDLSLDEIRTFFRDEQSGDESLDDEPPETDGWAKQKYDDLREQAELGNQYAGYRLSRILFDEDSPYFDEYDGAYYLESSAKQGYLHISKRKFLYMLQNCYIRYEDNGNKTHRYSLRMSDVEALRQEMTDHPERFADLNGRFTAQRNKPPTPTVVLSQDEAKILREYIAKCWSKHPDALPSKLAAELTGLTVGTLNRHVARGNIFGAVIGGKVLISKQSLIGYLTVPDVVRKVATVQMKKLLAGYKQVGKQ